MARAIAAELQPSFEWPDILPLSHRTLNNAPSPQRGNFAPITALTGMAPNPPIKTFYRTSTARAVTVSGMQAERAIHVQELVKKMAYLRHVVQDKLEKNREASRATASRGRTPS